MLVDKGNHRHFMAKEIAEQPEVIGPRSRLIMWTSRERASACRRSCPSISRCWTASPSLPAAPHLMLVCRQILVRARGAAAHRSRYRLRIPLPSEAPLPKNGSPSSCLSPARRRTRWPHCAIAARARASTRSPSSTCRNRPSRAKAKSSSAPMPARRSASPRPRRSLPAHRSGLPCHLAGKLRGTISRDQEKELVGALIEAPRHMAEILKDEKKHRRGWRAWWQAP